MTNSDIHFAYIQLGLEPGASLRTVQEVLANATGYKFSTRARVAHVRKFANFFIARRRFGKFDESFADIRKAYHKKAMQLHPDRNEGDKDSEEQLKDINAAYALIDEIQKQAKDFFKQDKETRQEIEREAQEETARERPASAKPFQRDEEPAEATRGENMRRTRAAHARAGAAANAVKDGIKYMAAPIPRFIRSERLSYLPKRAIIGSIVIERKNDINVIFDVVMLPLEEFTRARIYLASAGMMSSSLTSGGFAATYLIKNAQEVIVPKDEKDPEEYARKYFAESFNMSVTY